MVGFRKRTERRVVCITLHSGLTYIPLRCRHIRTSCTFPWRQRGSCASVRDAKGRDIMTTSHEDESCGRRWYGHTCIEIINRREPSGILMMSLTLSHFPRTHRRVLTVTSNTLELLLIPPIFLDTQSDSAGGRWTSGSATKAPLRVFTPIHFFIWSPSTSDGDWASLNSLYLHNCTSHSSQFMDWIYMI